MEMLDDHVLWVSTGWSHVPVNWVECISAAASGPQLLQNPSSSALTWTGGRESQGGRFGTQSPVMYRAFSSVQPPGTSEEHQGDQTEVNDEDQSDAVPLSVPGDGVGPSETDGSSKDNFDVQLPPSFNVEFTESGISLQDPENKPEADFVSGQVGKVEASNEPEKASEVPPSGDGEESEEMDELARMDAAKDADELDDGLLPKMRKRLAEMPGYIDFTILNSWQDVEEAVEKAGPNIKCREVIAAFTRLKQILGRSNTRFLAKLAELVIQNINEMTSWQVAGVFHACGKLRYKNADLFDKLATVLIDDRNTRKLHSMEMANCVYSLGLLSRFEILLRATEMGVRVADMYHLYSVEPPPVLFDKQYDLLEALCGEMAIVHRLTDFTEQELANTVYGLGLLRHRNTATLKALSREITNLVHLPRFNAQEISNIIYGFGLLVFQEDTVYDKLTNIVVKAEREEEFTTQNIANVLYGLARVNYSGKEIIKVLCGEILKQERLLSFREQEVSNIISCLSMLGAGTPEVYDALLKQVSNPEKIGKYVEHNLSTIVVGLAQAGHRNEEALDAIAQELTKPERMTKLTSKDIEDLILGFNGLDYASVVFMQALASELRKESRLKEGGADIWETCRANWFSWSLISPYP